MDIWAEPDILVFDEEFKRTDYLANKRALEMYRSGFSLAHIHKETGVGRQKVSYLINRCTQIDKNGREVGYKGLLKGQHVSLREEDIRKLDEGIPRSGSLNALFKKHPEIERIMEEIFLFGKLPGSSKRHSHLTKAEIHQTFLDECTSAGINPPAYPFCSLSLGKNSLLNWGKQVQYRSKINTPTTAYTLGRRKSVSRLFERVELDGHYVDINLRVDCPGLNGEGVSYLYISRLWLIACLEVMSTAVIGYSVSLARNYNAGDVTRAIRSCLLPWKPRELSFASMSYKPGECLPNALHPELSYVCFDELWLDNAKSHLSSIVFSALEQNINVRAVYGPRKSPNVRPRIEGFFDLLAEAGVHCVPGTTGSNPGDVRRQDINKKHWVLSYEQLLDLIDLLIVRYNSGIAPGTTISRNEVILNAFRRGTEVFRRVPVSLRENCLKYSIYDHGLISKDRNIPTVRWKNARYYGPQLSTALIGEDVLIKSDEDARVIEVSLLRDGTSLGELLVEPRWRGKPHSFGVRNAIRRQMTFNGLQKGTADITLGVASQMEADAKKHRKNHRLLARMVVEQRRHDEKSEKATEAINHEVQKLTKEQLNIEDEALDAMIEQMGAVYRQPGK